MGFGAVLAYAEETGCSWDEAESILYGHRRNTRPRCPICGKKCGGDQGIVMHMKAVHTAPRLAARVAEELAKIGDHHD